MCDVAGGLMAVSTLFNIGGGIMSIRGQKQAGEFNQKIANNNAFIQRNLASDARRRGTIDEENYRVKAGQFKSNQRARMLNSGGTLTGSNAAILDDTGVFSELDALMIRSNSEREAFEHEINAINFEQQGQLAAMGAQNAVTSTILGTGGQVASNWYNYAMTPSPSGLSTTSAAASKKSNSGKK